MNIPENCIVCDYPITDDHHIIPKSLGGTDNKENKIRVCPNHHRAIHLLMKICKVIDDKTKLEKETQKNLNFLAQMDGLKNKDEKIIRYFFDVLYPKVSSIFESKVILEVKSTK